MIKRKKIIAAVLAVSSVSMFTVGCTNNNNEGALVMGELTSERSFKLKDMSKVFESKYASYYEGQSTHNPEFVKKYNVLELKSYNVVAFNEETLEYTIDLTFGNKSDKKIDNIEVDLSIFEEFGGFGRETIKIKSLESNEECVKRMKFSLEELGNLVLEYSDNISISDYKNAIKKAVEKKSFYGELNYSYDNDFAKGLTVYSNIDFDGKNSSASVHIYRDIDEKEFKKVKTTHVEDGSYLNLVNPENKKYFDDIIVKNVKVEINNDLDITITTKFKNNGDKEINNFEFEPTIGVLGPFGYQFSEDELSEMNVYSDTVIKPGEEFEITTSFCGDFMDLNISTIDELKEVQDFDFNSKKETIVELIENRLISVGYLYSYDDGVYYKTTNASFTNTGKLEQFYTSEFPLEDMREIED